MRPWEILLLAGLVQRGNLLPKLWLLATFITTLVFTHLVLEHWHYYLMCCPPVALLCGATLARWEEFWAGQMPRPWLRWGLAVLVLVFSATEGLMAMKIGIDYDSFPKEMGQLVREHTKPSDKLIVYNCDVIWGCEALYRADETLHSSLRLDDVLRALVDVAVDVLHADMPPVWSNGRLLILTGNRTAKPMISTRMALDRSQPKSSSRRKPGRIHPCPGRLQNGSRPSPV